MAKEKGQHNQRYPDTFFDQHRREYYANCEKTTNDPVSLSFAGWAAPLSPVWARKLLLPPLDDRDVVRVIHRSERNRKGYQLEIDYDRWIQKIDEVNAARQQQILSIAQGSFKGADLLKVIEGDAPAELLKYVGPEAMPPREAILAMKHGDAWALGQTNEIPPKAQPILDRMRRALEATKTVSTADGGEGNPFADGDSIADDDDESEGAANLNPFRDDDSELEKRLDLEEQFDPEAVGGKPVAVKGGKRR